MLGNQFVQQHLRNLLDLCRPVGGISIVIRHAGNLIRDAQQHIRIGCTCGPTHEIVILNSSTIGQEDTNKIAFLALGDIILSNGVPQLVHILQTDIIVCTNGLINIYTQSVHDAVHGGFSQTVNVNKGICVQRMSAGINLRWKITRILGVCRIEFCGRTLVNAVSGVRLTKNPVQVIVELKANRIVIINIDIIVRLAEH